jgi:hypothetical protein
MCTGGVLNFIAFPIMPRSQAQSTGQLPATIPLLFNNIWGALAEAHMMLLSLQRCGSRQPRDRICCKSCGAHRALHPKLHVAAAAVCGGDLSTKMQPSCSQVIACFGFIKLIAKVLDSTLVLR